MKKMKFTNIISMVTAVLLAGCASDNEPTTWSDDPYAVKIKVTAGGLTSRSNPAADLQDPSKGDLITQFNQGDKISVNDGEKTVVYTLTEGGKWEPENGKYLKWKPAANGSQSFKAFYPYDGNASYDGLGGIVNDQSTLTALQGADFMKSETIETRIPDDRVLELKLFRQMARVVVKINHFNDQFGADEKVTDIKLFNSGTPYCVNGDGGIGSTYVYLTNPTTGNDNGFISLTTSSGVSLKIAKVPELKQGFSYTYHLNVGKDKIELVGATVEDWSNGGVIPGGGEAQAIIPIALDNMSESNLRDALNRITDDCIIKVTGPWANVCFDIFKTYLSSADKPKITLDLSEVEIDELPESAFASENERISKLYGIVLPTSVRKINKYSLKNTNISSIDLIDVTFVDECAFENCYELENVIWPETKCTFIKSSFDGAKWKGYAEYVGPNKYKFHFAPPFVIPSTVVYSKGDNPRVHVGFLCGGYFEQVTIPADYKGTYEYLLAWVTAKKIVVEGDANISSYDYPFLSGVYFDILDISNCSNYQKYALFSVFGPATEGTQQVVYVKTEELRAQYEEEYKDNDPKIIFKVKGEE